MPSRTYRFRGRSRTHGRGRKSGRGAGIRGGRGNAGLHKHKYMAMLKYAPDHFGKHGFTHHPMPKSEKTMNVSEIEHELDKLITEGYGKKIDDVIEINLTKLGIDKLLGSGTVSRRYRIIVPKFSEHAYTKIKNAGGEIISSV